MSSMHGMISNFWSRALLSRASVCLRESGRFDGRFGTVMPSYSELYRQIGSFRVVFVVVFLSITPPDDTR